MTIAVATETDEVVPVLDRKNCLTEGENNNIPDCLLMQLVVGKSSAPVPCSRATGLESLQGAPQTSKAPGIRTF